MHVHGTLRLGTQAAVAGDRYSINELTYLRGINVSGKVRVSFGPNVPMRISTGLARFMFQPLVKIVTQYDVGRRSGAGIRDRDLIRDRYADDCRGRVRLSTTVNCGCVTCVVAALSRGGRQRNRRYAVLVIEPTAASL